MNENNDHLPISPEQIKELFQAEREKLGVMRLDSKGAGYMVYRDRWVSTNKYKPNGVSCAARKRAKKLGIVT